MGISLNSLGILGGIMIKEKKKNLVNVVKEKGFSNILNELCFKN